MEKKNKKKSQEVLHHLLQVTFTPVAGFIWFLPSEEKWDIVTF